jgi:hypothetical protein
MLRREGNTELQELKNKVKELSDEVMVLKRSKKSDSHNRFTEHDFSKDIGKSIGNMMFKGSDNYNKQLLGQFYKMFSSSVNVPSSFGGFDKGF